MLTLSEAIAQRQAKLARMQQLIEKMREMEADLNALLRAQQILNEANDVEGSAGGGKTGGTTGGEQSSLVDKIEAVMEPGEKLHADVILMRLRASGTMTSKNSVVNTLLRLATRQERFRHAGPNIFERVANGVGDVSEDLIAGGSPQNLTMQ
jgi:hypothetical protein